MVDLFLRFIFGSIRGINWPVRQLFYHRPLMIIATNGAFIASMVSLWFKNTLDTEFDLVRAVHDETRETFVSQLFQDKWFWIWIIIAIISSMFFLYLLNTRINADEHQQKRYRYNEMTIWMIITFATTLYSVVAMTGIWIKEKGQIWSAATGFTTEIQWLFEHLKQTDYVNVTFFISTSLLLWIILEWGAFTAIPRFIRRNTNRIRGWLGKPPINFDN